MQMHQILLDLVHELRHPAPQRIDRSRVFGAEPLNRIDLREVEVNALDPFRLKPLQNLQHQGSLAIAPRRVKDNIRRTIFQRMVKILASLLAIIKLITSNFLTVTERVHTNANWQ